MLTILPYCVYNFFPCFTSDTARFMRYTPRHGSFPDALRSQHISPRMKDLLRCLQAVQGQVPCTDASRRMLRGELASLTTYFGYPLLFVTLNPADVLHPFTWRHALATTPEPLPDLRLDEHLLHALQNAQLWKLL